MCIWTPRSVSERYRISGGLCRAPEGWCPTWAVDVESEWVWGSVRGLERLDSREVSCPLLFLLDGLWG